MCVCGLRERGGEVGGKGELRVRESVGERSGCSEWMCVSVCVRAGDRDRDVEQHSSVSQTTNEHRQSEDTHRQTHEDSQTYTHRVYCYTLNVRVKMKDAVTFTELYPLILLQHTVTHTHTH